MKIYIAGPCTDCEDHNFPAFTTAAEQLAAAGHQPVNPTRRGVIPGHTWADYMRLTLADMLKCDAVAVLHGWENSRGATLEVLVAEALHMPVRPVDTWLAQAEAVAS